MQHESAEILRFMRERQLSQDELAEAAGVSQSTVCRSLAKDAERRGAARARLINYVRAQKTSRPVQECSDGWDSIVSVARGVWNGTDAHARLIIEVLGALADKTIDGSAP